MTQVEISFSPGDIERVLREWERINPGKVAEVDLGGKEFADLMLADMYDRAKVVNPPEKKP